MFDLESSIRKWKNFLRASGSVGAEDLEELEAHLRDSIDDLGTRGVDTEEAFLLSVRRLGELESLSREFSLSPAETAWRHLLIPASDERARARQRRETTIVALLAALAVVLFKIPALVGYADVLGNVLRYGMNLALFSLPSIAIYLIWKRSLPVRSLVLTLVIAAATALVVNLYPSREPFHTSALIAVHLPIAGALAVGVLYCGPSWRSAGARLDFVRFAGEVFIFSVLIGLGGWVLSAISIMMFSYVGVSIKGAIENWILPGGLVAVLVVASFLVERKKSLLESIAPVLARIFVPLFLLVVTGLVVTIVASGRPFSEERELLIGFDVLLALVVGLVLYTMSARDSGAPANAWDAIVLALIAASLIADAIALTGIAGRLVTNGVSANKTAALGENVVLLVDLILLAIAYARFVAGRIAYGRIVTMQMRYLPVYALWAAFVVIAFPPLFGFV